MYRDLASRPDQIKLWLIQAQSLDDTALYCISHASPQTTDLTLIRVATLPHAHAITHHIVTRALSEAALRKTRELRVSDPHTSKLTQEVLLQHGLSHDTERWARLLASGCVRANELPNSHPEIWERLSGDGRLSVESITKPSVGLAIEEQYWPLRLWDLDIPTYIVSIRPHWAERLFDEGLASQTLFPRPTGPALSWENAYFRAPSFAAGIYGPGRILWYVTQDPVRPGSASIRACSHLTRVLLGTAGTLFRRFEHFGTYDQSSVLELAGGDPDGRIMVLTFKATEPPSSPVSLSDLREIVKDSNFQRRLQSPTRITTDQFAQVYRRGTSKNVR